MIVSRNHELDRAALASALRVKGVGYIGMIGSRRKVGQVFAALRRQAGVAGRRFEKGLCANWNRYWRRFSQMK